MMETTLCGAAIVCALAGCSGHSPATRLIRPDPPGRFVTEAMPTWCTDAGGEFPWSATSLDRIDTDIQSRAGRLLTRVDVDTKYGRALALETIRARAGQTLDPNVVEQDLKRLYALEIFQDLQAKAVPGPAGVELIYELSVRPPIRHVFVSGVDERTRGELLHLAGTSYELARLQRLGRGIAEALTREGYSFARATVASQVDDVADVCFLIAPGPRVHIGTIRFLGHRAASSQELAQALELAAPTPVGNRPGGPYDPTLLSQGLLYVRAWYYDHGYVQSTVSEPRTDVNEKTGAVTVEIDIEEGPMFWLGRVSVTGAPAGQNEAYRRLLRLTPRAVFSRAQIAAARTRLEQKARCAGGAACSVYPVTNIDLGKRIVDVEFQFSKPEAATP